MLTHILFKVCPWFVLWGSRLFLLAAVLIHAWTAYSLIVENRKARPEPNEVEVTKRAGLLHCGWDLTGSIILAFIVFIFFILQFVRFILNMQK